MNLSDEISKLAASYDPDREAEGQQVRALLQGMMMAGVLADRPTTPLRSLVKIEDVEQLQDADGNYLPYYTVIMQSGTRVRVTLEVE